MAALKKVCCPCCQYTGIKHSSKVDMWYCPACETWFEEDDVKTVKVTHTDEDGDVTVTEIQHDDDIDTLHIEINELEEQEPKKKEETKTEEMITPPFCMASAIRSSVTGMLVTVMAVLVKPIISASVPLDAIDPRVASIITPTVNVAPVIVGICGIGITVAGTTSILLHIVHKDEQA